LETGAYGGDAVEEVVEAFIDLDMLAWIDDR